MHFVHVTAISTLLALALSDAMACGGETKSKVQVAEGGHVVAAVVPEPVEFKPRSLRHHKKSDDDDDDDDD
ncbi:unnamed protein product [Phytophthora lilii]|uniref:Unnamed protein product n=1 Tax=Phytophthora lilii TaxID=2077276 RepID=A0A9W6TFA5_9STRA|nr:unnamed protein product [Phytophthora lilii]